MTSTTFTRRVLPCRALHGIHYRTHHIISFSSPFLHSVGDLEVSPEVIALLPEGYLPVSVKSGQNVVELRENIETMLLNLTHILQQRQESKDAGDN